MGRVSDAKERLMEAVLELIWRGSYGSTTIDQICDAAGVKKGSFYYFFESKADLAVAALDQAFKHERANLDAVFSPVRPPMERFKIFFDHLLQEQRELKERYGFVLGCPLCTLGTEVSTQEEQLQKKVQEIMEYHFLYIENAVRDAHASGEVSVDDPKSAAKRLFTYYEGLLMQARIRNDLNVFNDLESGTALILGLSTKPVRH
ncbi:MAG: TetR/AcrR family transcriptional regulator [Verrucomicrobiota bacterium]|nr:TetR/AcrR family transcriptional regulator [Verrucomicrobiota bacterium]